ncbi:hypothetical protein AWC29_20860 [Mycobacterium triplex]|uniref:Uncharacterized protein n=1 Tax=Mycobacterium triplex TaxID=47839 RepID=A0A024JY42_9MYCO|nr:hypothetical protein [Mycobacterium triplex]ORX02292.1 hypothetical protein AWC29_20860 [Mycobacterium triplex]CDO88247.1 hypothetical protein BN973_02611 [Mycobacterium triplex]
MRSASSRAVKSCAAAPLGQIPSPGPRSATERIVRREYLRSECLGASRRGELAGELYDIYSETLHGYTPAAFDELVFGTPRVRLALFYGARDELAGFAFAAIDRIEHGGRIHAVMGGGGFFRSHYRGGPLASLFILGQGIRARLREPHTPLAYLTRATTPAAYRRLAVTMPTIYPSRRHQTPVDVEALVRALSPRRHYIQVNENPWVVRSAAPHDPSRLQRLDHDPDVRFYLDLNPGFAKGESLLVWVRADMADLASGFARAMRAVNPVNLR